jgi:ATP-dependent DNA helicase RecQ
MEHAKSVLDPHLAATLGPGARFRDGQREAIEAVIRDGSRALVVQRTGWGKSLVYWIASRVRRDEGHGPTLIISPLLALMRNQIEMAGRLGLRAVTIHSGNTAEWTSVEDQLTADAVDVLLISPERLANESFTARVLPSMGELGLFVIDEAHCISDWGHDFRPDYRRIGRLLRALPASVPVLATTATANDRVVADVVEQLGDNVRVVRGPLARETLRLDAIALADQAERLAWLAENIPRLPGSGVIYCLTIADTQRVASWLRSRDVDARAYSGPMLSAEREALEQALIGNELKVLVATVALGMGFDKPDLGFVVHYQRPGSPIAYYQQVGRAGRAVERSYGILLSGREDDEIADYFLRTAFPPTVRMQEILDALEAVDELTVTGLQRRVNLPRGQIEQALKLLEIDGAVAKAGPRWSRTAVAWEQDEERIERVKATRRAELQQMRDYVAYGGCYMEFLIRLLDDPEAARCGRCANDAGRGFPSTVDPDVVQAAIRFLRRDLRPIEPRRQWVDVESGPGRKIDPPNEPGFALCVYGDPGWGQEVARGKEESRGFSPALVVASVSAIRDRWTPEPPPEWVTAVPSRGGRTLVRDVAAALASELGLPYVEALTSPVDGPPQDKMQNSVLRLENARRGLGVVGHAVLPGPVLLVDDVVDSGWTLTVAGALLSSAGSGPVFPFALAAAGRGGG